MKKLVAVAALAAGVAAVPAQAEIVDFSVGDNSFRLALYGPLSRLVSDVKGQYDIGAVVKPKTSDDLLVVHTGALLTGDAGLQQANVAAGLGLRAVYVGRDHDSGGALAAGGQVEARFPGFDRVGFSLYGYGAPDVTSFGEVDKYYEIGVGVDYQLIQGASIYAGWREIQFDIGAFEDVSADDSAHLGLRLHF